MTRFLAKNEGRSTMYTFSQTCTILHFLKNQRGKLRNFYHFCNNSRIANSFGYFKKINFNSLTPHKYLIQPFRAKLDFTTLPHARLMQSLQQKLFRVNGHELSQQMLMNCHNKCYTILMKVV